MKTIMLLMSIIGSIANLVNAVFHLLDGDMTGAMVWTLCFFITFTWFVLSVSIRD